MFHHILAPLSPWMDTSLALKVGEALARGDPATEVSVAPLEPLRAVTPSGEEPVEPRDRLAELVEAGGAQRVDLIIIAPRQRELCEIEWYPHTAAWSLLRLRTPLLFWPPEASPASLMAARKPVIAVPLDGHTHSESAIPFAYAIAEAFGGQVMLVSVAQPTLSERQLRSASPAQLAQRDKQLAHVHEIWRYLQALRQTTAERTSLEVTTKILLGHPGSALVRLAQRHGASAIVMTTHSHAQGGRYFAGAVATQALRQSPAPVLLIPLGAETTPDKRVYHVVTIPVTP